MASRRWTAGKSAAGSGLAILVNANAKRGGRRIAAQLGRALPGARIRLTRTIDEIEGWLKSVRDARCILAAGGDGTAIALINAMHHVIPKKDPFPCVGLLPLGTGNAWARSTGARKLGQLVDVLAGLGPGTLPTRRFGLVECEGILTGFAGCGWDAQILDDYKKQLQASRGPGKRVAKSVYGYLGAVVLRTTPKQIVRGRPHVLIENMGDAVYTVDPEGRVVKIDGIGNGAVLYEGLASVAGCATVPEFGYGFRAFPFAERLMGQLNVRIYDRSALGAFKDLRPLWHGTHPLRGMHDWFASAVRMTFSRPMPLQIGGDAVGERQTVDYRISERTIEMLDWRTLN
ncbi:diacylglycerol/lipid kinase family protein [Pendulispora albinea]|uniref:Diacylglycerol kinase n=1 Tax=Pendulispora albinea TaxID=2741071 RepID=A0ABZ2LQ24_9BACT